MMIIRILLNDKQKKNLEEQKDEKNIIITNDIQVNVNNQKVSEEDK